MESWRDLAVPHPATEAVDASQLTMDELAALNYFAVTVYGWSRNGFQYTSPWAPFEADDHERIMRRWQTSTGAAFGVRWKSTPTDLIGGWVEGGPRASGSLGGRNEAGEPFSRSTTLVYDEGLLAAASAMFAPGEAIGQSHGHRHLSTVPLTRRYEYRDSSDLAMLRCCCTSISAGMSSAARSK